MQDKPVYRRVLLKISGEAIKTGLDKKSTELYNFAYVDEIVSVIKKCMDKGVQFAIIVGGGNIWRGRSSGDMDRSIADHMGMLATVMNCLCLKDAFANAGIDARVMTTARMDTFGELFTKEDAIKHLEKGRVVLLGGGIGAPFFSTDTPAVLRGAEIEADVVMMAKNVSGVYTADPEKDPNAKLLPVVSYTEILRKNLGVIDMTAAALARDTKQTTYLFGLTESDNIYKIIMGETLGTIVKEDAQ